jgi:hypothetical protein
LRLDHPKARVYTAHHGAANMQDVESVGVDHTLLGLLFNRSNIMILGSRSSPEDHRRIDFSLKAGTRAVSGCQRLFAKVSYNRGYWTIEGNRVLAGEYLLVSRIADLDLIGTQPSP